LFFERLQNIGFIIIGLGVGLFLGGILSSDLSLWVLAGPSTLAGYLVAGFAASKQSDE
jgi:hypothetical protein